MVRRTQRNTASRPPRRAGRRQFLCGTTLPWSMWIQPPIDLRRTSTLFVRFPSFQGKALHIAYSIDGTLQLFLRPISCVLACVARGRYLNIVDCLSLLAAGKSSRLLPMKWVTLSNRMRRRVSYARLVYPRSQVCLFFPQYSQIHNTYHLFMPLYSFIV